MAGFSRAAGGWMMRAADDWQGEAGGAGGAVTRQLLRVRAGRSR